MYWDIKVEPLDMQTRRFVRRRNQKATSRNKSHRIYHKRRHDMFAEHLEADDTSVC